MFAFSLLKLLQRECSSFDVKTLDYKSKRLATYEFLKRFKLFQKTPFFYAKRARLWSKQVETHLALDKNFPHFASDRILQKYFTNHYAAIVVGMDVWCIINGTERPGYRNIYWLPERIDIPKIAYGVSAYNSDLQLIQRYARQIGENLDGFDVIGARDHFTYELVQKYRHRKDGLVEMIPDPTFTYEIINTGVAKKLESLGIDLSQPTLGLLFYGNDKLSSEIQSHYKSKKYQILALGMYNPVADFNLGHVLTPFEWAETFRYLSFCISDRYHGTIFCLLNHTPFISLEKDHHLHQEQSKIYDLLTGFNLESCYRNPADENFESTRFFAHANEIESSWEQSFKPGIQPKLESRKKMHFDFAHSLKEQLRCR